MGVIHATLGEHEKAVCTTSECSLVQTRKSVSLGELLT